MAIITNVFPKILHGSGGRPKKIWVDQGSTFNNRPMKS